MSKKKQSNKTEVVAEKSGDDNVDFKHQPSSEIADDIAEKSGDDNVDIKPQHSSDIAEQADDTASEQVQEQSPVLETVAAYDEIPPEPSPKKYRRIAALLLIIINFLLIIGLIVVAYYFWQLQQKAEVEKQQFITEINQQFAKKADNSNINSALSPIKSEIGRVTTTVNQMQQQQQGMQQQQQNLQAASEELYILFGRDENGWKLAEVDYLMRIAQHKLILENDFEGAALTLQAASDRIGATADTGLLPVRVKISQEIANLKTRSRPDLVGMTLLLSQLGRQVYSLNPGFSAIVDQPDTILSKDIDTKPDKPIVEQVVEYLSSLVSIKKQESLPTYTESRVLDVEATLSDNLKLTRWALLERDSHQFAKLMKDNLSLFEQYYNLDDAANNDFYKQLQHLQKTVITPEKPNISGSLELLKQIISQRELAPEQDKKEGADDV